MMNKPVHVWAPLYLLTCRPIKDFDIARGKCLLKILNCYNFVTAQSPPARLSRCRIDDLAVTRGEAEEDKPRILPIERLCRRVKLFVRHLARSNLRHDSIQECANLFR